MRLFTTLEMLDNYIPNCFICHKKMQMILEGRLASISKDKPRWDSGRETAKLKLTLKDGLYYSSYKSHNVICINPVDNKVVEGMDLISRMIVGSIYANKLCHTCHLKIKTEHRNTATPSTLQNTANFIKNEFELINKEKRIPALALSQEELHYTLRGGVDVKISKYYDHTNLDNCTALITLNHKHLPPMPLDFDKFKDLEHLNKRLATIKLFH